MAPVSAPRSSPPSRNQLLAVMSATDLALLRPHLRPVAPELLKDPGATAAGDAPGFVEIGEAVAADDQTTRL